MAPLLLPPVPAVDRAFASSVGRTALDMIRAFYDPEPPFRVPASWLVPLLVAGIFLVVAGTAFATHGKGKFWPTLGLAAGGGVVAWVLFGGGRRETLEFLAVLLLVLKFLGGVTFVLGFFRSFWVPLLLLACLAASVAGLVDASLLGRGLSVLASFLGAVSLFHKAEEFSPGRTGSRWNRRVAVGWVACLAAAAMLDTGGLGAHGGKFKVAGMVVGLGLVLLYPSLLRKGGVRVSLSRRG